MHFDSNGVYSVRWVVELAQDGLRETSARPGTIESVLFGRLPRARQSRETEHRASSASASASTSTSTLLTCSIPRWSCKVVVVALLVSRGQSPLCAVLLEVPIHLGDMSRMTGLATTCPGVPCTLYTLSTDSAAVHKSRTSPWTVNAVHCRRPTSPLGRCSLHPTCRRHVPRVTLAFASILRTSYPWTPFRDASAILVVGTHLTI